MKISQTFSCFKAEERANKYEVHSQELEATLNELEGKIELSFFFI